MFLTHSFPYMEKGRRINTGSGGYGYNNYRNIKNGAGGGIIYIFSKETLDIENTNLEAVGGEVS